jgi:hypothetical protein
MGRMLAKAWHRRILDRGRQRPRFFGSLDGIRDERGNISCSVAGRKGCPHFVAGNPAFFVFVQFDCNGKFHIVVILCLFGA